MATLGGRNALVTGAGSGIGRAIAAALVERSVHVTLADIDDEAVRQLAETLGPLALPLKLDVTDHAAVDELLDSIPPYFGRSTFSSTTRATTLAAALTLPAGPPTTGRASSMSI